MALLLGASGAFGQLQSSLNRIWNLPPKPRTGWKSLVRQRLVSFALVVGIGFLLLVSLIVSAGLAALGRWIQRWLPGLEVALGVGNELISFFAITLLFALMYRVLPDLHLRWRDVWIGAAMTSFLFVVGKALIGFYVTQTRVGAAYGVAGSIVVVLVWIYYTAQVIFFGAELTQVFTRRYGSLGPEARAAP